MKNLSFFEVFLILLLVIPVVFGIIIAIKDGIKRKKEKAAEELRIKKEKAIKEHGYYYNNVFKLNESYHLAQTSSSWVIDHYAKSKAALDRLKPNDIVIYYFENNINGFTDNFERIMANREQLSNYSSDYNKIIKIEHTYSADEISSTPFENVESFIKHERALIQELFFKEPFIISVDLNAYYSSPTGKNNYSKCYNYSFENVLYCYEQWLNSTSYKVSAAYERSLMTDSLRYDILKRDNFRCQICGASANDGVKLHVDHIIPVSKGGKTEPSNLQTLCERCNLGKSNKL